MVGLNEEHPVVRNLKQRLRAFGNLPVEEAVLKYGREFTEIARPKGFRPRAQRRCFKNAIELASNGRCIYVEGFGLTAYGLAHHAWATLDGRRAIDVTWRRDPSACYYFGIPFANEVMGRWVTRRYTALRTLSPPLEYSQAPFDDILHDVLEHPARFDEA